MNRLVSLAQWTCAAFCLAALLAVFAAPAMAQEGKANISVGGIDDATGGSIKGVVKFAGKQLARKPIRTDSDATGYCTTMHAKDPLLEEKYVFGDNDALENVFVYVSKGLEGKTFPTPTTKAVINQEGCSYHPHVMGVVLNQPLEILNDDNALHNVKVESKNNGSFNEAMAVKGTKLVKKFAHLEMPIEFRCNVHVWMSAYVMVMPNPFFAVTQQDGTFEIKGLPPGDYELSFWHEIPSFAPDKQAIPVKVEAGKAAEVTVTYAHAKKAS